MATQPTQDAVPSESPRDLKFNAGKIDEFVTSMGWTYTDRFGVKHYTIEGLRWLAQQAIAQYGYITLDSFEDGNTLTLPNQVLRLEATGEYYRWDGAFPKTVPANSTPETTGGIGAGKWLSVGDATLRGDLATGQQAALIGYEDGTVKSALDELSADSAELSAKTGFNAIGRFLNIAELRNATPATADIIVYVASAASSSHAETHLGGGFFQSVDNVQAWPDDGGIVIKPATGTLVWKRINFTAYDMQFWGVKADGVTDNAAAITLATNYARANRIILDAPAGNINTSQMVPIYNNMGIRGQGVKAEGTVFWKTTNNAFPYKNGSTTVVTMDALVGLVPNKYDRADSSMDSFCVHARLEACMFRRYGLTEANVDATRPAVGLFINKAGAAVIRQVAVEGGYQGVVWYNIFSSVMEMVSATQWAGHGYSGFSGVDYRDGVLHMSGTSVDMRLCQTNGYQFGFDIRRLEYTTMTNCTAETITPLSGETVCYAFNFVDPYCIIMNTCATEFVKGGQIRVSTAPNPSFVRSLTVNGYLPIDQQNPVASTPIYSVDSGAVGSLKVTFIGGDLSRQTLTNLTAPLVSGSNAKVVVINAGGEDWVAASGGEFIRLG
ncbi:phage tail protein [Cronobacter sakazakii]|uniref:tail fiber/spike domain-containing protein n=1 Tax=Cronobacter sakazakii TaxID=28141 RepID=UPI001EFD98C8|nr:phage tail protein [Cronobacter sakazakii]